MKLHPDRPPADPGAKVSGAPNISVRKRFKRWLVIISGWSFVALGVAGLFLPILQGVLFLLIGLTILSTEYVWAHKLLQKLRKRFPSLASRFDTAKLRAHAWLKRIFPPKSDGA
jgi:uncharacterized protein